MATMIVDALIAIAPTAIPRSTLQGNEHGGRDRDRERF